MNRPSMQVWALAAMALLFSFAAHAVTADRFWHVATLAATAGFVASTVWALRAWPQGDPT